MTLVEGPTTNRVESDPASATRTDLPPGWPRKIALVCDWYYPRLGGIERHLTQLADRLVARGHAVTVITPMAGAQSLNPAVPLISVRAPLLPGAGLLWKPASFRQLGELLRSGGFDVVHVHSSIISPAAFAALYHAQKAGLPTVSTTHSILGGFTGCFAQLHRWFGWGRWPIVYSAVSRRVTREFEPLVKPDPVLVLPNAVDPAEWSPGTRVAAPTDTVTAACVMRLVPRKRGAVLLRALATARRQLAPGQRIELRIAGDGPQRARLQSLVRTLGLGDVVTFLGAQTPPQVKELLCASGFFVLPCRLEAFGLAALEARAIGLPVLAMRESGVSEFITHQRDGLLADDDDQLATHLVTLFSDAATRARITQHNRTTTVSCTWDRVLQLHQTAYEAARERVRLAAPRAV